MNFLDELRRRNVFRVGIAYAVVAWLVLQVADVMIDNIGAPDWLFRSILLVLAMGLPVVLLFAWAFELTPEGIKRDHEVDRSQSITPQTGRKLDRAIIVVLTLALGYIVWDKVSDEAPTSTPGAVQDRAGGNAANTEGRAALDQSIAVLPFVNMSADADNEYFSDGLSEELLNLLARVEGLKVAARTSTFKFKNSDADIAEIGETLKVATVLEGSVRKAGDQVRITAQLIKVDDGFHLWSQTYDRNLDNIFAVQDEIASAIVEALRPSLLGEAQAPVEAVQASSFEAYDLYLLGKHHAREVTGAGYEKAIDYYTRAVNLDPEFVPAWSELARAIMFAADFGSRGTDKAMRQAGAAIDKALALDPESVDALVAQATLLDYLDRHVELVEVLERVLRLDPNQVDAHWRLARRVADTEPGRALALSERALALDPLADYSRGVVVTTTAAALGLDAARERYDALSADDPDNPTLHESRAWVELQSGNLDLAIVHFREEWEHRPGDAFPAFQIARAYLMLGDDKQGQRWVERAEERAPETVWVRRGQSLLAYYRGEFESLLPVLMSDSETTAGDNIQFLAFLGDVLIQLKRLEEAEATYRHALDLLRVDNEIPPGETEAELLLPLASLLPEGPERNRLLGRVRERIELLRANGVTDRDAHLTAAGLAAQEGDREGLFTALDLAIDNGYRGARFLELDPVFRDWRDDPRFREAIGRLNRLSDQLLARLQADAWDTNPDTGDAS